MALITWNPPGTGSITWPADRPLYAGTPPTAFADPNRPTLAEVNAAEGYNQIIAEINRRLSYICEMKYPKIWPMIYRVPYGQPGIAPIPVGGLPYWWPSGQGTEMDASVLANDYYFSLYPGDYYSIWRYADTYGFKPTIPGNGSALFVAVSIILFYEDWDETGTIHFYMDSSFTSSKKPQLESLYIYELRRLLQRDYAFIRSLHVYQSRSTYPPLAWNVRHPFTKGSVQLTYAYPDYPPVPWPITPTPSNMSYESTVEGWGSTFGQLKWVDYVQRRLYISFYLPEDIASASSVRFQGAASAMTDGEVSHLYLNDDYIDTGDDIGWQANPPNPSWWVTPPGVLLGSFTPFKASYSGFQVTFSPSVLHPGKNTFVLATKQDIDGIPPKGGGVDRTVSVRPNPSLVVYY